MIDIQSATAEIRRGIIRRPASADRTARRQFQATGQLVSRMQASDAVTSRLLRYEAKCVQRRCFQCGSVRYQGNGATPCQYIDTTRKAILIALQLCRWQFLYNETLQQTFRPLLSKLSKIRQIEVFYPHFEEVRGGVEHWLMAHWQARVDFLLTVIELLFLSLAVKALQGKMCQNSLPSGGSRSLGGKISGEKGPPPANILTPLEMQLIALQLCCCNVEIVQKTTNLGSLSQFWRS